MLKSKSFLLQVSSCATFEVAKKIPLWAAFLWWSFAFSYCYKPDSMRKYKSTSTTHLARTVLTAHIPVGQWAHMEESENCLGHKWSNTNTGVPLPHLVGLICASSSIQWLVFRKLYNFTVEGLAYFQLWLKRNDKQKLWHGMDRHMDKPVSTKHGHKILCIDNRYFKGKRHMKQKK